MIQNKKFFFLGVLGILAGFGVLTLTDPQGQNWASYLSPILLVIGYSLMGVGFVLPRGTRSETSPVPIPSSPSRRSKKRS